MNTDDTLSAQEELKPIELPTPECDGVKSVWPSLWERKTTRDMRTERLPPQVLSNVLRAAFGVTREDGPMGRTGRTAPSGLNLQGVDIYVAPPEMNPDIEEITYKEWSPATVPQLTPMPKP